MDTERTIQVRILQYIKEHYQADPGIQSILLQKTRKDFPGDLTLVVFPFVKMFRKSPEDTGKELGEYLVASLEEIHSYNVIKGFLNLEISRDTWKNSLKEIAGNPNFGIIESRSDRRSFMIEYSSPNTNKPLHLGHIRNNLIGCSLSLILEANGHHVQKVNLVNDRGIHICKSMLAWQKWGNGETPENSGKKGDHLVGDYYVKFDREYKKQIAELVAGGMPEDQAAKQAPLIREAQEMLRSWESGDKEVNLLWSTMNSWVYAGFDQTYKRLGVRFDKIYYESETYKLGRAIVLEGLEKGVLDKKEDGSIWADLTGDGLDRKLLLRSDGTSVYMTQDIGTAHQRFTEFDIDEHIYVVGNEQNYHFQVLALILKKLGYEWADHLTHLSYGMVELPEGKMKSREGTVVDADDLMDEMQTTARDMSLELGKLDGFSEEEKDEIFRIIGAGALKYFILKVDPKKNMTFDPVESVDFNGNTGPFIQYSYARIRSVLRKAEETGFVPGLTGNTDLNDKELNLIKQISYLPEIIQTAGDAMSPALLANYCYELAREFNQFYHEHSILSAESEDVISFRLLLSVSTARVLLTGMRLLGIELPERM